MEVVNRKGKIQKLNDNILSEVAGGLEISKPLNIAVLTDDKVKKEDEIKKDKENEFLQ